MTTFSRSWVQRSGLGNNGLQEKNGRSTVDLRNYVHYVWPTGVIFTTAIITASSTVKITDNITQKYTFPAVSHRPTVRCRRPSIVPVVLHIGCVFSALHCRPLCRAVFPMTVCPSVCLSVRLSVKRVNCDKTKA